MKPEHPFDKDMTQAEAPAAGRVADWTEERLHALLQEQAKEQLERYAEDFGLLESDYESLRDEFARVSRERDKAREMQRAFEAMVGSLDHFGFVSTDAAGVVANANAAAAKCLGIPAEHLPGRELADFLDPQGRAGIARIIEEAAPAASAEREEFACHPAQPGMLGLQIRVMRVQSPEDPGYRFNWLLHPAQQPSLHKGVDREVFSALFSKSSHAILVTDPAGTILSVNEAFCAATGYGRDEVIGLNPRFLQSGRQDPAFYGSMWRSLESAGEWKGEICNRRKNGEIYKEWLHITSSRDASGALSSYVGMFYDLDFARTAHERIYHLAHYDSLTGLPNRELFNDRLGQTLALSEREQRCFTLLFLDLDGFKEINDTLGHDVGDEILKEFARRLAASVRASDTVARLGGDEFVIIAEGVGDEAGISALTGKIIQALKTPVSRAGHRLYLATSIGAACYPRHGEDAGTLLRNADAAMYVSKRAGGNDFRIYSDEFNRGRLERLSLASALRQALPQGQLSLVYQPQVDAASGRVMGVEALLRWQLPGAGTIGPEHFIPIAESSGLIVSIGNWVLEQACAQQVAWRRGGLPALRMAVNVSARQLNEMRFADQVLAIVARTGIDPHFLELEVTEGPLMESLNGAIQSLGRLRQHGITIAVDDFGTGYSSLGRLQALPIDRLKIDRSFVLAMGRGEHGDAIPRAILAMAQSLQLTTVAEGVETEAQFQRLRSWRCDQMQGYFFARPGEAPVIAELMKRFQPAEAVPGSP